MIYGDEKARNMARSILPSKRRRGARMDKQALKRRNRHAVRQNLHDWKRHADPLEYEGHIRDYYSEPRGWGNDNIHMIVQERRDADKLAAMQRWAVKHTAHLKDPEDRYNLMKRTLPDNLPGRHALSHLEFMDEFAHDERWTYWRNRRYNTAQQELDMDAVRELVAVDLERVNRVIKRYNKQFLDKDAGKRLPLCEGLSDEGFFQRCRAYSRPERRLVEALLAGTENDKISLGGSYRVFKLHVV